MRTMRILLSSAALTVVLAVSAAPADAATRNPYTAVGICGGGFHVIKRAPMREYGRLLAGSVLTWNPSTKRYCAVTLKRREIGKPSWTEVWLRRDGSPTNPKDNHTDQGSFSYYAGPVYMKKQTKRCMGWGGSTNQLVWRKGGWWAAYRTVNLSLGCP
jgi:hypothetical protein